MPRVAQVTFCIEKNGALGGPVTSVAAISNAYHAPEDRTASRSLSTFVILIRCDGLDNELKEFWPDIRRKVFRKNKP